MKRICLIDYRDEEADNDTEKVFKDVIRVEPDSNPDGYVGSVP